MYQFKFPPISAKFINVSCFQVTCFLPNLPLFFPYFDAFIYHALNVLDARAIILTLQKLEFSDAA